MLITSDIKIMGFLSAKKFIETWDELFRGFPLLPEFRHLQQHKHGGHSQLRVLLCAAWLQRHDSTLSDRQSDRLHHSIITHVFIALEYKYTTVWVAGQKDLCHVIKHTDRKHSIIMWIQSPSLDNTALYPLDSVLVSHPPQFGTLIAFFLLTKYIAIDHKQMIPWKKG